MKEKNFIGYEYHEVAVKQSMESVYADSYGNFGWELEERGEAAEKPGSVIMKFKRDRKISNKTELIRLQRNFDACVSEILSLETSKKVKASIVAYVVGFIGTAFMAGSVFAVTSSQFLLCVILAIPAFLGWIFPYFLYRRIEKKRTAEVTPYIEQKYDELYAVCEKANSLLEHTVME